MNTELTVQGIAEVEKISARDTASSGVSVFLLITFDSCLYKKAMIQGKRAEELLESIRPGDSIYLTGTLKLVSWVNQDDEEIIKERLRIKTWQAV